MQYKKQIKTVKLMEPVAANDTQHWCIISYELGLCFVMLADAPLGSGAAVPEEPVSQTGGRCHLHTGHSAGRALGLFSAEP